MWAVERFCEGRRSRRHGRQLIEKADCAVEATALQGREVGALRTKLPGKAHLIAVAIGLSHKGEAEAGEMSVHAGNESIDLVMAFAVHERIPVSAYLGPDVRYQSLAVSGSASFRRAM